MRHRGVPVVHGVVSPLNRRAPAGGHVDEGSTLLEVVLGVGLVAVVAGFGLLLHMTSVRVARQQANEQVSAQLLTRAVDTARAAGGAAMAASPPPPAETRVNGVLFTQRWSVTVCRQQPAGGVCTSAGPAPGRADLVRVVVAVQWAEGDVLQSQRTAVLLSAAATEPTFTA